MKMDCLERIGVDGDELKHMQVNTHQYDYDKFEKMGEGKFKCNQSYLGYL